MGARKKGTTVYAMNYLAASQVRNPVIPPMKNNLTPPSYSLHDYIATLSLGIVSLDGWVLEWACTLERSP